MKKVFMFLLAASIASASFAQKGYDKNDNKHNQHDKAYNNKHEKDALIDGINRKYDDRIEWLQRNVFVKNYDKRKAIKELEKQRKQELNEALARFDNQRNHGFGDYARNDRH